MKLNKKLFFSIFRFYRHNQARLHPLNYLFWECTLKCNLDCVHCGSDCSKEALVPDMPLGDFLKVLDRIKEEIDPRKIMVVLTGGEPTLRKDLEIAGKEFIKRGFPWGMVSNAYALSKEKIHKLHEAGLGSLTISLDGLKESHDWFRGHSGSFERALGSIQVAAGIPQMIFDVVSCIHKRNLKELPAIRDLLIENGVKKWRLFIIFPKGRAKDNPELKLSDEEFRSVYDFIVETRKEGKINASAGCEGFLGDYELEARDYPFFCRAGIQIGSVLVDGSISACPSLREDYIQGNIYRDDFMDVWTHRFDIMRNRKWTKTGRCKTCKVYPWCEGNGLHLRDEKSGELLLCHYEKLLTPFNH
ncbi:MAG: TIGR04133 family radical SAM/SPASM protein [Candidatus Marinimicrobia bacterium]|nr:TIGR04133 family radical SAM/SPASM protein [Candidatus Neomarinimicrobiota bacterium]